MTIDYRFVIKKLQGLEEIYVAHSIVTRMPYATCDEETFNDQVWVFDEQEKLQEFIKEYAEKQIMLLGVRVQQTEAPMFYMNLFYMGINEVVYNNGGTEYKLELKDIVKIPEFDKLPENQKPVMNQELVLSAAYFLQTVRRTSPDQEPPQPTPELKEMEEEMSANLVKAQFLMPMEVEEEEPGKKKIKLVYVQDKSGTKFQPLFTDPGELMKYNQKRDAKTQLMKVTFDQLPAYMIPEVKSYIVNPQGINLPVSKEQIAVLQKFFGKTK